MEIPSKHEVIFGYMRHVKVTEGIGFYHGLQITEGVVDYLFTFNGCTIDCADGRLVDQTEKWATIFPITTRRMAIIGKSGSGKTVLARLIRHIYPSMERIEFRDEYNTTTINNKPYRFLGNSTAREESVLRELINNKDDCIIEIEQYHPLLHDEFTCIVLDDQEGGAVTGYNKKGDSVHHVYPYRCWVSMDLIQRVPEYAPISVANGQYLCICEGNKVKGYAIAHNTLMGMVEVESTVKISASDVLLI